MRSPPSPFRAISTGIYRFPAERAARLAVATTLDAIQPETSLEQIVFCCFSDQSARVHDQALVGTIAIRA
jgi:O-acetyl-ADP-ribose deacetylase (regulator of RNase III)